MAKPERRREMPVVKQMLPADGWLAVYADNGKPSTEPLVMWVLASPTDGMTPVFSAERVGDEEQWVTGLIWSIDFGLWSPEKDDSFLGYIHVSQDLAERYADEATDFTEREEKKNQDLTP